jgi:hypothetical protein
MITDKWIKSSDGFSYFINSWSSDSNKYILKISRIKDSQNSWVIDAFGLDSLLVIDEPSVDEVKKTAIKHLKTVLDKICLIFNTKKREIEI